MMNEESRLGSRFWVLVAAVFLVAAGFLSLVFGLIQEVSFPRQVNLTPIISVGSLGESTSSGTLGLSGEEFRVTKVVDGDTIEIEGGAKVRYIGVDTPETVDPRRPVGCFGREASDENKRLAEGNVVILVKDVSETDKFGRLLRYVYVKTPDDKVVFVNDHLVRQGFARVSTYPPDVKFTEQLLQAEREAREGAKGLWQQCL